MADAICKASGGVLNSGRDRLQATKFIREREVADAVRLLRILVADIRAAGPSGVHLTATGALFQLACQVIEASPEERASAGIALTALREFVWRVDSVRSALSSYSSEPAIGEALNWLNTSDIHVYLRQDP